MNDFRLQPGDVLVNVNKRRDIFSRIKRWAMSSPYEHVFMYLGQVGILIFESDGDGVIVESLSSRYGQEVVVLRLKSEFDRRRIPCILEEAIKLANDIQARYDYMCIVKYVLPRLICEKLGLPMPLAWHRDRPQICSEAVYEVFHRAKLVDVLYCTPPLPGDFVTDSPLLGRVWFGTLSEALL